MSELILTLKAAFEKKGGVLCLNQTANLSDKETPTVIATSLPSAIKLLGLSFTPSMLDVVSTTVHFPEEENLKGFGILFPKNCDVDALGVLFNRCIFPNRSLRGTSETWILGGAKIPTILSYQDEDILALIGKSRKKLKFIALKPDFSKIHRWEKALPHYDLDLEKFLDELELPENIYLTGNYLGDIGLSGILANNIRLVHELKQRCLNGKA